MPIVKRKELDKFVKELEERYSKLRDIAAGTEPNPNVYEQYHNNPEQYRTEFREVSEAEVKLAVDDFNNILKALKNIKTIQAQKLGK